MTLITWLVVFEFIVGFFLVIWLIRKAVKHSKHSPAEVALRQHLEELEAEKTKSENQEIETVVKPKKGPKK